MLRFFSASTGVVNSRKAMAECLETALAGEDSLDCNLIIIHCSIGHNFEQLLAEASRLAPTALVVGCTGAGVVGNEGPNESMRALAVMAVKSENKDDFCISYSDNIRGHNSFAKARQMAHELKEQNDQVNMVMILASGMDIAADKVIEGIESGLGKEVPIFGGTSSDNKKAFSSFQFFNREILERGAVLVGFADPKLEVVMGVHHGNLPIGMPFEVTKSEGNRVFELDGEPAWPFLMNKLDLPADTHPGSIIEIAGIGELLPEDLHEEYENKYILRAVVMVDEAYKSFYMPVDCPVGKQLWLTRRDEGLIVTGLEKMIRKVVYQLSERELAAVFHTDCVARGKTLFNKILKEEIVDLMQGPLAKENSIPWLGLYGFGEFTLLGGKNRFHNYTTSIYALVRK